MVCCGKFGGAPEAVSSRIRSSSTASTAAPSRQGAASANAGFKGAGRSVRISTYAAANNAGGAHAGQSAGTGGSAASSSRGSTTAKAAVATSLDTKAIADAFLSRPISTKKSEIKKKTANLVEQYAKLGLKGYRDHLATLGQDSDAEFTGEAYSVWDGSFAFGEYKEKALFVDENACIGCQNCVHCAPNSFAIEPVHGRARVVTQWADHREKLNTAFDSCPVDCIHWVQRTELPLVEYAMRKMDRTHVSTQSHGRTGEDPFEVARLERHKKIVWSGPSCKWPKGT